MDMNTTLLYISQELSTRSEQQKENVNSLI